MKWIGLLMFGLFGVPLLVGGGLWTARRIELKQSGVSTTGTVVDFTVSTSSGKNGGTFYYPVVEFTAADGRSIRFPGSTGSGSPEAAVGEKVAVLYPADNPEKAQIETFGQFWLAPLVALLFGVLMMIAAVGSFMVSRSVDRSLKDAFPGVGLGGFPGSTGRRTQAKIATVEAAPSGGDELVITYEWFDETSGEVRTFRGKPMHFKVDHQPMTVSEAQRWVGQSIPVSVDSSDPPDLQPDFVALMQLR